MRLFVFVACLALSGLSDAQSQDVEEEPGIYETWGSWSPEGEWLVGYSYGYGGPAEVFRISLADGTRERLTDRRGNDWFPTLAHGGEQIVFVSDYNFRPFRGAEIYTMNPEGGDIRQLTADGSMKMGAAWSPQDDRIVYAAPGATDYYDIWMMDSDGSNKVNLTNTPDQHEMRPDFHPEGDRLVFVSLEPGVAWGDRESNLHILNLLTGRRDAVTHRPGQETRPEFSPDGSKLVFSHRHGDTNHDIYVLDLASGDWQQLTQNPASDHMPHWSPNGEQISFSTYRWGDQSEIYVMNADGTEMRNVTRSTVDQD